LRRSTLPTVRCCALSGRSRRRSTRVPLAPERGAYLAAVRTYFSGFERDAQAQLTGVDRELDALYQRQYNLAAERGVAQKRLEAVEGVLASLAELATS